MKKKISWFKLIAWVVLLCTGSALMYVVVVEKRRIQEENAQLAFKASKSRTSLEASEDWRQMGFLLRPGDQLHIQVHGEYSNSLGGKMSGAGNAGLDRTRSYDPLFPHGCLIARIRGNPTRIYHIGAEGIMTAADRGRLEVKVNDLDIYENRGSLVIEAKTFFQTPEGVEERGSRDSNITPISR